MIRQALINVLLFLTPFLVYSGFLAATRAGVLNPDRWNLKVLVSLTAVGIVILLASFYLLAQRTGQPAGSTYIPPHVKDGKLIPGQFK
jgi:hypothetical protein